MVFDGALEQRSLENAYRILLVEDDLLTLEMMSLLLSDSGYEVLKASGLEEALEVVGDAEIDLVVSDIGLPDGDALELMSELRDRFGIPGISVSGYASDDAMREAGFVEHVTKPIEFNDLITIIEKLRNSPRYKDRGARVLPLA